VIAHGGVYGAIGEAVLAAGLGGLFVWIWLRERRRSARGERPEAEMHDEA
jgi:hypothetical protein